MSLDNFHPLGQFLKSKPTWAAFRAHLVESNKHTRPAEFNGVTYLALTTTLKWLMDWNSTQARDRWARIKRRRELSDDWEEAHVQWRGNEMLLSIDDAIRVLCFFYTPLRELAKANGFDVVLHDDTAGKPTTTTPVVVEIKDDDGDADTDTDDEEAVIEKAEPAPVTSSSSSKRPRAAADEEKEAAAPAAKRLCSQDGAFDASVADVAALYDASHRWCAASEESMTTHHQIATRAIENLTALLSQRVAHGTPVPLDRLQPAVDVVNRAHQFQVKYVAKTSGTDEKKTAVGDIVPFFSKALHALVTNVDVLHVTTESTQQLLVQMNAFYDQLRHDGAFNSSLALYLVELRTSLDRAAKDLSARDLSALVERLEAPAQAVVRAAKPTDKQVVRQRYDELAAACEQHIHDWMHKLKANASKVSA